MGAAARRSELLRLLAQPSADVRRPCVGCGVACACTRRASTCACGCSARCPHAAAMLAHLPGQSPPVHPAFVPFLFELATLRVFRVFWPMPDRYCGLSSGAEAGVMVGTSSLEHADLLAHHVAYASTIGRLSTRWRVALAPHMAGAAATTISIEPTASHLGPDALAHDLAALADGLAASVLRLARVRLFCLRRASDERTPVELSGREREVLDLFLAGLSAASIAQRLFISLHTARNHLKHVNAKLGVASQRELRELFATSME